MGDNKIDSSTKNVHEYLQMEELWCAAMEAGPALGESLRRTNFWELGGLPFLGKPLWASGFWATLLQVLLFVDAIRPIVDLVQNDKPARFPPLF